MLWLSQCIIPRGSWYLSICHITNDGYGDHLIKLVLARFFSQVFFFVEKYLRDILWDYANHVSPQCLPTTFRGFYLQHVLLWCLPNSNFLFLYFLLHFLIEIPLWGRAISSPSHICLFMELFINISKNAWIFLLFLC